jgi:hypothetical protein
MSSGVGILGNSGACAQCANGAMDELGLTPDYRLRGLSALVEKRSSVPGRRHQPYVINEYRLRGHRFSRDVMLAS